MAGDRMTHDMDAPKGARRMPKPERRRFQRVKINVLGRFMLPNRAEYPCQVVDMSPGGVALMTPVSGEIGARIVAYLDHLGRIEGEVTRHFDGGFAMSVNATARKRDKLAAQLTWLANRQVLNLPEDRRHERMTPRVPVTNVVLPDGREMRCRIIDVSLSGAAIALEVRPALGTPITIGRMRARVVRHFDDGVAIEFAMLQTEDMINNNL